MPDEPMHVFDVDPPPGQMAFVQALMLFLHEIGLHPENTEYVHVELDARTMPPQMHIKVQARRDMDPVLNTFKGE